MANETSTSSMLAEKRKSLAEEDASPSQENAKKSKRVDDCELDSVPAEDADDIEPVAKPDIQIFPGFWPNDVTLLVADQHLYVNKDLLASASPVFEAWLKNEWQKDDGIDSTRKQMEFPGKTYNEMDTFLKCLLPIFADRVTVETLGTVLPLADEYQAEELLKGCEEVIQEHVESVFEGDTYIPPFQIVNYLMWVGQHNLQTVEKYVVRVGAFVKAEELEAVPDYQNISHRLQRDVFNVRTKLLEDLLMLSLPDIEKKIHELQVPVSPLYMAEWKRQLADKVQKCLKQIHSQISTLTSQYSKDSYWQEIKGDILAIISICDRFRFSAIYQNTIAKLPLLNIDGRRFRELWKYHFSVNTDPARATMERHVSAVYQIQ